MNADLLDRLREADKATWDEVDRLSRMFNGVPWVNGKHWQDQLCSDGNKATREALKEAWLQACLQDAIRVRKWELSQWRQYDPAFPEIECVIHCPIKDLPDEYKAVDLTGTLEKAPPKPRPWPWHTWKLSRR